MAPPMTTLPRSGLSGSYTRRQSARRRPRQSSSFHVVSSFLARSFQGHRGTGFAGPPMASPRPRGEDAEGGSGGLVQKFQLRPGPMPTHMVTMPYFRFLRCKACTTVADRIAPVAPSGWPSAMAPPIGLTLDGSSPSVLITASDCAANASFSSIQSMSLVLQARRSSARRGWPRWGRCP
jgi:hypothetical protein